MYVHVCMIHLYYMDNHIFKYNDYTHELYYIILYDKSYLCQKINIKMSTSM